MFRQVIPRSFVWLVSLYAVLTIGIAGCGGDDDDDEWVGTWAIETVDGQSFEQALGESFGEEEVNISIVTNSWTFNDDGTIEAELAVKLESKGGGSEISIESSVKPTGTYSLSGFNYTLTTTTGSEGLGFGELDDTGTWSRSGNTLTLNSDDGTTIVFKKQ